MMNMRDWWGGQSEPDFPTTRTIDHKLRVEAKMDYDRCVGEIEDEIAAQFKKLFRTPIQPKYLGSDPSYVSTIKYKRFSTGDLIWRMYIYDSRLDEAPVYSFEVAIEDNWHNVDRPADLWIALGHGDKL